jgi:TonB-linked SusC/RagA family outer membrane protein
MKENPISFQARYGRISLVLIFQFFIFFTFAQVRISGRVTSSDGKGIPDISVSIRNTTIGTVTDADGAYSLGSNLKPGTYDVVFSGVGFKAATKTVQVGNGTTYSADAQLGQDVLKLDEVVVIGSSITQSRKQLGNTINSVNSKQLANTGTGNMAAALQGKVAGAQITQTSGDPAGGISIRLRGTSTVRGSAEPLYVIDGVIVSNRTTNVTNINIDAGSTSQIGTNRLADINTNDIEKIDIIPGAAASAIYGSQASNGVVLITTKKGRSGAISVDFQTSVNMNELRKKVYISTYGKQFGAASLRLGNISNYTTGGPGTFINYTRTDGTLRSLATNVVDVTRYDYQDNIFQKAAGTDNYISISGGTDKTKIYASASYLYNGGIIKNTDFRRYGFRGRIEQTLSSWASLIIGTSYSNSFSHEKPNGNSFWSPTNSVFINNNIYNITDRDIDGNLKATEPTRINPLSVIETLKLSQEVNRTVTDVQLKLRPTKNLSIDYIFGIDAFNQEGKNYIPPYPYAGVNPSFFDKGYAGSALVNSFFMNNDVNVGYKAKLQSFSFNTVAGFNQQSQKITGLFLDGRDMLTGISTVDGASTLINRRYSLDKRILYGAFLQETFGYKNLVFVTVAGRIDGATQFATDKRNFFYPKVSGSFSFDELKGWQEANFSKWFNSARVRFSWGQAGNLSGVGTYDRFFTYTPNNINGIPTYNASTLLNNPNIEPERAQETEAGLDIGLLKNRLGIGFTWYDKKVIDGSLLVLRTVAPSSGGSSIATNDGSVQNKGWEVTLNAIPVQNRNFSWTVSGSVSHNKNKVISASQALITLDNAAGAPAFIIPGEAVGVFYGTYYERDAKGNVAYDANGRFIQAFSPTTSLRKVIGNPNPEWLMGVSNSLSYKNFTLSALLDGAFNVDVFNADRRTRQGVGIGDVAEQEVKGEVPRGYIWSFYGIEEWRVEDGSFVKLRELSLSYQLPRIARGIRSASVTLVGRNLHSWDNYKGYDPETNAGGNSTTLRGIDFGNVPIPRTYQFIIRLGF